MGGQTCGKCGGTIEKLALGGGDVNVCPVCQR
jgi:formamidopyrimidine-DNA glycosylase